LERDEKDVNHWCKMMAAGIGRNVERFVFEFGIYVEFALKE